MAEDQFFEEVCNKGEDNGDNYNKATNDEPTQTTVYRFPLKQTSAEKEREETMLASHQVISATQQSRVNQVTHDLVQWVQDLVSFFIIIISSSAQMKALFIVSLFQGDSAGEQYAIDEPTIKSLFGSDYESKVM